MDVTFTRYANFTISRGNWYKSNVMTLAYKDPSDTLWQQRADPTWDQEFGEHGSFKRIPTNILAVDGINIVLRFSNSSFTQYDSTQISQASNLGIWPFYGNSSTNREWHHSSSFSSNTVTVTSTCALKNPQILGVVNETADEAFGS